MADEKNLGYSPENARSPQQHQVMVAAAEAGTCIFCEIDFMRNQPLGRLGEFDPTGSSWPLIWVWRNPFPQEHHAHHIMIVPKRHIMGEDWADLTLEEWAQILDAWKWAQGHFRIPGGGFVCRFGARSHNAGTVGHLHFQLQVPDLTGPVKATFFKSDTPEDRARREARLKK